MIRFLQTPGRTKKLVLGGLLVLICAAMVITLIPGGFAGGALGFGGNSLGNNVIAKVGDEEITVTQVQDQARNMGRQQFPKGLPSQLMPFLIQRASESLIMQRAMLVEAQRLGLKVSDEELMNELQQGPFGEQLFPGGKFIGEQQYEDFVANFNMSVPQFEQAVKDDILRRKLIDMISGGVTVSQDAVVREFKRQNTKVKFEYAALSVDEVKKQIHPSEAELKAYYEKNKQMYTNSIPEKRKVRYILVDLTRLSDQAQVTPDDLQRYYREHQDEYRVPDQVNVRHILIKTPTPGPDGKVDQKGIDAAKKKAEDILKQLKSGGNFAELAKKYSEDPGSAKNGGSLGWIQRGRTVPEFEKAAFSTPVGQTTDPVQSSYGFHIIHVDDKQEAHLKSLDEVKAEIEPAIRQQKAAQAAEQLAGKVETEARTQGIEKAAADNHLQVTNSEFVARTDSLPGLGSTPEFMNAVFSARPQDTPDMTNLKQGYVIYQVTEMKPAATPNFEEARARVRDEFVNERSMGLLNQKTQELSDRARAQHDLKKAAKEEGATVKSSDLVNLSAQVPDLGAMSGAASVAFGMKAGEISGPLNTGTSGVVLELTEKQEPTQAEIDKGLDTVRDQLAQQKREQMFELFVENLKTQMEKRGKIQINGPLMKQLTTPRNEESS
jgi:peptidyl-prolyl cis-trans isomerase D